MLSPANWEALTGPVLFGLDLGMELELTKGAKRSAAKLLDITWGDACIAISMVSGGKTFGSGPDAFVRPHRIWLGGQATTAAT